MKQPLIGKSKAIKSIILQIRRLAAKQDDVLIIGEQGSGKSIIAKNFHDVSVSVNKELSPVEIKPANIVEKELSALLYGSDDETTNDLDTLYGNLSSIANGNTIIIEEIERANYRKQKKILNFLKYIENLRNRSKSTSFSTRIIITTISDPIKLGHKKQLVPELVNYFAQYTRLFVPPLRDRTEDIPYLVEHFVAEACEKIGIEKPVIDINAINILVNHQWKHNIRELKTVIEQSVVFSTDGTFNLPPEMVDANAKVTRMLGMILTGEHQEVNGSLDTIERNLIDSALRQFNFNFSRAAEFLGMNRQKLKHRIDQLGIQLTTNK